MQNLNENIPRALAIFAGNYIARNKSALEKEQIIKVLAQTMTSGMVSDILKKYVPDTNSFVFTYQESILMFGAVALTDLAYERVLEAWNGKPITFDKKDLKEAIYQGLVVAVGNAAGLY